MPKRTKQAVLKMIEQMPGNRVGIAAIAHASRDLLRKLSSKPWDLN